MSAATMPESPQAPSAPRHYDSVPRNDEAYVARKAEIKQFFDNHMQDGVDWGKIPKRDKNVLFKPGAEKLKTRFGLAEKSWISHREYITDANGKIAFIEMEATVELYDHDSGCLMACEPASYSTAELTDRNPNIPASGNKCRRMAKKRAMISAVKAALNLGFILGDEEEDDNHGGQRDYTNDNRNARNNRGNNQRYNNSRGNQNGGGYQNGAHPGADRNDGYQGNRPNETISDNQRKAICSIASKVYGDAQSLLDSLPKPLDEYTRSEASQLIERLQQEQQGGR